MPVSVLSIEEILGLAIQYANAGDHARANLLCERADATGPTHPAVKQLLAVFSLQKGHTGRALQHANNSLALRPDHVPTLVVAGDAARAAGAIPEAMGYYARASQLQPDRHSICLSLGISQHQCGRLDFALQTLARAAMLAPDHVDTLFQFALVQQDVRDLDNAALTLAPHRADAHLNLGVVLQDMGRMDDAMNAYGCAYQLHEDSFGRIVHALAASHTGRMWLDPDALRAHLRGLPA